MGSRTAFRLGTAAAIFGATVWAPPVLAQGAPSEDAVVDDEDIVVTARRRDESLFDVPIAVTALSGAALDQQGITSITEVASLAPNVTLEPARASNSTLAAFIRGVGQQDPAPGFEAGVGIYLDDVYLNRPQGAVLDIYEVDRIEVLRGPQGTLYGRNTIGGAVKYVTRALPADPEFKLRAAYGSYDQADLIVTAAAPLGDMVRVGGAAARLSRGGFGDNLARPGENYNKDVWAGRGTIEFRSPDDRLFVRLSGDYTKDNSDARGGHRFFPGLLTGAPVPENVFDTTAGLSNPKQDVEAYGLSLTATAELTDEFTLRSISAWRKDNSSAPADFDALPSVDVDAPIRYANEQVSQEFQLLYEGDRLQGLVGFYYLDADSATDFNILLDLLSDQVGVPGFGVFNHGDVNTKTWSAFADFSYDLTDRLAISLGGRYTFDQRSAANLRQFITGGASPEFGGTATPIATTSDFRGSETFREFTPRASISFKPVPEHLLYLSYSKGFKGGGFDIGGEASATPDFNNDGTVDADEVLRFMSFEPERVDSFEAGWKARLLDDRLNLALTAFYTDYKDVQIPGNESVDSDGDGEPDTFIGVTSNAGKARMKGIELETQAVLAKGLSGPGSSLRFNGSLGYIDAKFLEFIDAFGADVADQQTIQNTPKWSLSGTLVYETPLAGGIVNASTSVSYRSLTHQYETPNPFLDQPGYALWDASLTWTSEGQGFSFGIHARNIANKKYITSGYNFVTIDPNSGAITPLLGREGILSAYYGNPRQVFVTAGLKF